MDSNNNIRDIKMIKGFDEYSVSIDGKIWSYKYTDLYGGTLLKKTVNSRGYAKVSLFKKGSKNPRQSYVHRLVAETFIPNPKRLPQINHKNGIKTDNRVDNLEWCSAKQNSQHAFDTGLSTPIKGSKNKMSKLTEKQVKAIKVSQEKGFVLAKKFGVSCSSISMIRNNITWKHA